MADGAEILSFDATAGVTLSDGRTCALETVPSVVKVKGFKSAVLPPPPQTVQLFSSRLDASNGYVER